MSAFRRSLNVSVEHERLFAVAVAVTFVELAIRLLVAGILHPIAFVALPPVVAAAAFALVVPSVRAALAESTDAGTRESAPLERVPSVLAVTVGGHALALAVGATLFLVLDTPVRYVLYWTGNGDLLTIEVIAMTPLPGVAIGAAAGWALPAVALARLADGERLGTALADALSAPLERTRPLALLVGCNVAFVALVWAIGVFGLLGAGKFDVNTGAVWFTVLAVGLTVAVVSTVSLCVIVVFALEATAGPPARNGPPVARVGLALLLVAALVTTAGAVRFFEYRPMDTAPAPLPDDPDEIYATALDNTDRASHAYHVEYRAAGGTNTVEIRIDRANRRFASVDERGFGVNGAMAHYVSTGTADVSTSWDPTNELGTVERGPSQHVVASPGYPNVAPDHTIENAPAPPPSPIASGWEIVDETADELVLSLTDSEDVLVALWPDRAGTIEAIDANESWARAVIDTDRETLLEAELRLDVSYSDGEFEETVDIHRSHEFEVDVAVDRPTKLGSPTAGELCWRLFAY